MRRAVGIVLAAALAAASTPAPPSAAAIVDSTWVDHDRVPIRKPKERELDLTAHKFRESIVEPLSHAFDVPDKILWLIGLFGADVERDAANVNAFDEVANSSWFTNRNHVRALTLDEIRGGPGGGLRPQPPYNIRSVKREGVNPGFRVRDGAGRRWLIKFDPPGYPQLGSGAGTVSSRLLWAAGYNFSHDVSFRFRRDELSIDADLAAGNDEEPAFGQRDLDSLLQRGHRNEAGETYAQASLLLTGAPVGPIDFRGRRRDHDANDWYKHRNRRELRGLYVMQSWVGNWDLKDQQSLDMFEATQDSLGSVRHFLLDAGASLGAAAEGPKQPHRGYEYDLDWGWTMLRILTLGFVQESWRSAHQETGIPSVGNFSADQYEPNKFKPIQQHAAFRERTDADGYWGAKLVASFSDAQVAAAVEAAQYEDPRATETLTRILLERRDKTLRYWFSRVAPVDFFHVDGARLRFHDLAVDRGLVGARAYRGRWRTAEGGWRDLPPLSAPELALDALGEARSVEIELGVAGLDAQPAHLDLVRDDAGWRVRRVWRD